MIKEGFVPVELKVINEPCWRVLYFRDMTQARDFVDKVRNNSKKWEVVLFDPHYQPFYESAAEAYRSL